MNLAKKIFGAVVMACALAQPAAAQQVTVDSSFATRSFSWQGNNGILIRTRPIVQDGAVFICGIYTYNGGARYAKLAKAAMKEAKIKIGGQIVFRNLNFFASDSPQYFGSQLDGRSANCRQPSAAINPDDLDSFEIEFRSGRYRVRN